jgi:hypothetical protein
VSIEIAIEIETSGERSDPAFDPDPDPDPDFDFDEEAKTPPSSGAGIARQRG